MSQLHLDKVFKTYPGHPPVEALKDIRLDIAAGEFVALLGPSGCGKSTLLNLVASFEPLTSGTLTMDGKPILEPGPDRGVVFQEAALFPWLSVWENVVFGPKAQKLKPADYEPRAERMLEIVGLKDFKHHLPIQLSGGMRQRVGIAHAGLQGAADGRAVWRAGRADPLVHARALAVGVGADQAHGDFRHPRH